MPRFISTPDMVYFNGKSYKYYEGITGVFPFIVAENKIYWGQHTGTHGDMKNQIIGDKLKINPNLLRIILSSIIFKSYDNSGDGIAIYNEDGDYVRKISYELFNLLSKYSKEGINIFNINFQLFGRLWVDIDGNGNNVVSIWPGNRFKTGNSNFSISAFNDDKSIGEG